MEALMTEYASSNSSSSSDDDIDHKENENNAKKESDTKLAQSLEVAGTDNAEKVELTSDYFGLSNVCEENSSAGNVPKGIVKRVENTTDYFGLSNVASNDEINEEVNKSKPDVNKLESVNVKGKLVSVEIPETNFWNDVKSSELQSLQDRTIERGRKDWNDVNRRKRNFPRSEQKNCYFSKSGNFSVKPKQFSGSDETPESSFGEVGSNKHRSQDRKLYFVHPKIAPLLHNNRQSCRVPSKQEWECQGHRGAVNRVKWNVQSYSHLFVTCSMDSTIKIWNIWSQLDPCVKILSNHTKAVRDADWSQDGKKLLSCSYDKTAAVIDVEKGCAICMFQHTCFVSCGKWHPTNPSLCVTGGHNQLQAWDTRTPDVPIRNYEYKDNFGQVQDILFLDDGSTLFSSSDLVSQDSADRNLMAWDFTTGVTLSNQIYQERYTISRLKLHPQNGNFLAQSNGNYIAVFSTTRPYKMNRQKRFEGHKLLGYSLGFDITPDGSTVISGSSDGKLYSYNYQTGKLFRTLQTDMDVIMDLSFHPLLPSIVACCAWDGSVQVWK